MTVNHRLLAEEHLATAARHLTEHPSDMRIAEVAAWIGQGYATLALTPDPQAALEKVVVQHIADSLTSGSPAAEALARSLLTELDAAGLNITVAVDNLRATLSGLRRPAGG
ncbi:MAG TPA: hypothetical protein VNO54_23615 [Streptosporangiaceae bacterium]|nr:hypothetical protein [Streptosporangiaceae bacterium]